MCFSDLFLYLCWDQCLCNERLYISFQVKNGFCHFPHVSAGHASNHFSLTSFELFWLVMKAHREESHDYVSVRWDLRPPLLFNVGFSSSPIQLFTRLTLKIQRWFSSSDGFTDIQTFKAQTVQSLLVKRWWNVSPLPRWSLTKITSVQKEAVIWKNE